MKAKYILMMVAGAVLASCMGNSYTEIDENGPIPYGNNNLTESKVITIAKLKDMFATEIETDYRLGVSYLQVTDSLQIKGIVTSSDAQGNIYNEIRNEFHLTSSSLPIFIIADSFNRVVFISQGYTIGLGEQLLKVIGKL